MLKNAVSMISSAMLRLKAARAAQADSVVLISTARISAIFSETFSAIFLAAVPAEGARAVFSLLQEGEYADDDGAVRLVRGFGLLSAGVSAVAVLGCAFAVLLAVRLFGAYFVSKERQNAVLRLCGAHRSGVFWLNWLVLAAAGALSLAVSVPLFYAWRAIVEALSSAIMGMQFGAPPPLAAYLGAGFAVYLAAAAAVCAVRAFSARVGREMRL